MVVAQSKALAGGQHEPCQQRQLGVQHGILHANHADSPQELCLVLLQQMQSYPAFAIGPGSDTSFWTFCFHSSV